MKNKFSILFYLLFVLSANVFAAAFTIEAENMTLGGSYTGKTSSPFSGIALYGNGDKGSISNAFSDGDGVYQITLIGASSNSSSAGVSLYINGVKLKAFSFSGTTASTQETELKITGLTSSNTIELLLETDNGSNDTYIDKITFTYKGEIPPVVVKEPPVLPAQGAYYTGAYRNMFKEAGYTDAQINQRLEDLWSKFFYGDASTQAVYYPVGTDEAYILDTGNDDVRSEGMSYGMMICVQLNKKEEFDRLWKWAKNHMQHQSGDYQGYFAWQLNKDGNVKGSTPASDGEEYFITALMFASARWGNGEGIFNYWKEANDILAACTERPTISGGVTNLFNATEKQVVFCPISTAATFTDPSYHLPAFYELWSKWADKNRSFWAEVAKKSREMWPKFAHPTTGLMPDYAEFSGAPHLGDGDHGGFYYDAWRCIMNMAVDYAWFKADETEAELVNRQHNFFESKGIDSYGSLFALDGTVYQNNTDHSPGLVSCNATGALASNQSVAWDFIDDFFKTGIPSGKYRYYDGLLYFMNYLHLSGNFKIYEPSDIDPTNPDNPDNPSNPDTPGQNDPDGYFFIHDFEADQADSQLYNANNVTVTVKANPTVSGEQSGNVIIGNYSNYWKISVTLPTGTTLADYEKLMFDIYLPSGSGYDNSNKAAYVAINSTQLSSTPSGNMSLDTWIAKECTFPSSLSALDQFDLYLGYNTNNGNFYLDNIRLLGKPGVPTVVENIDVENNIYCSGNILYIGNTPANLSIFDMNGRLLLSKDNLLSQYNISGLNQGIYIAKININGKVYTKKIAKF